MKKFDKPKTHPKFGLAIDWETSGSDWNNPEGSHIKYQGLSFGAIVFDADTFEEIDKIYVEMQFDSTKYSWDSGAEKVHGLSRDYLAQNGISREEAAVALGQLILKYWGPDGRVMFLGHNIDFDIKFTKQLLGDFGLPLNKHHVQLDTSGTGMIMLGIFKSDQLFEALGFDKRGTHNALDDVQMTLETCRIMRAMSEYAVTELGM